MIFNPDKVHCQGKEKKQHYELQMKMHDTFEALAEQSLNKVTARVSVTNICADPVRRCLLLAEV